MLPEEVRSVLAHHLTHSLMTAAMLVVGATAASGQTNEETNPLGQSAAWLIDKLEPIGSCRIINHQIDHFAGELTDDLWRPIRVEGMWVYDGRIQTPLSRLHCDLRNRLVVAFFLTGEDSIFRVEEFAAAPECRRGFDLACRIDRRRWNRYRTTLREDLGHTVTYAPASDHMEGMQELVSSAMTSMSFETARRISFDSTCYGSPPTNGGLRRVLPEMDGGELMCMFSGAVDDAGVWRSQAVWVLDDETFFFAHRSIVDVSAENAAIGALQDHILHVRADEAARAARTDAARQQLERFFD